MRPPAEILKAGLTEKEKDIIFQVLKTIPLRVRDHERRANYFGHEVAAIIRAIIKAYQPKQEKPRVTECEAANIWATIKDDHPRLGYTVTDFMGWLRSKGFEVVEGEK